MVGKFRKINNPSASEQEDSEYSPENSGDSPRSGSFGDSKITSTSSPKSRRGIKKRVVSVPITDVDCSRQKGESAPPSDSWAWRKYGQKPIKGSPYPRGYYRCSSSKGCPARKQVERSRVDPTTVVVTYSCEHNHPSPASKSGNHYHQHRQSSRRGSVNPPAVEAADEGTRSASATVSNSDDERPAVLEEERLEFENLGDESLCGGYDFRWISEFEATSSMMLESPIFDGDDGGAVIYTMREEDESLFADLEELPECSVVFRRGTGVKVERTVL